MSRTEGAASPNRYYVPGEERSGKVRLLFSRIAGRYDLVNDLMSVGMHRRWKRRLARSASPRPGEEALDICCGTGDVARALVAAVKGGDLKVTGLDFTEEMLRVARRLTPAGTPITFQQGDALAPPFADARFDLVTVAYGLRNLADLDQGLREALRVLRPGGRLVSLEFGRPRNPILRWIYLGYLRLALPLFGFLFFADAQTYGYIFATVSQFPGQQELAERMRAAGFASVRVQDLMGGVMGICVAEKSAAAPASEAIR